MEGREAAPAEAPVTAAAESAVTFRLAPPTPAYNHSAAAGAPAAPPLTPSYNHSAAAGAPAAPPLTPAYTHSAAAGALAAPPLTLAVVVGPGPASAPALGVKKKRGRPRKYGLDGRLLMPLNPSPISASAPYPTAAAVKRGRGRPEGFISKQQHRTEFESLGEMVACSAGASFTPHVITVASGEDVTMKIISFAQQGPQAICILSANGIVSNVTLRQPESSGGTLTYEGRFELLSLSGSFMPTETGGTKSRSGGMSVALASADGRVVGRGVSGLLVAAGPVQVVVGSFMPGYQMEQNTKKLKLDTWRPTPAVPISSAGFDKSYGGLSNPKPRPATSSFFHGDNWVMSGTRTMEHKVSETRNSPTEEKRSSYFRL